MNTNANTETHTEVGRDVPIAPLDCRAFDSGAMGASRSTSLAPQTLDLALQQLHDTLKKCGVEQCENLIKGAKTGYAQFVAALEKLSKLALDWEEHQKGETPNVSAKAPGYSQQTEFELEEKIEGPPSPKPQ